MTLEADRAAAGRRLHLLVFSTLFPWPAVPHHGVFVLERLRAFLRRHGATATVIAPVPYAPKWLVAGRFAVYRDVPAEERYEGIRVLHPRYLLVPKISMSWAPLSLAAAGLSALRRLRREGLSFDLVDAHYLYPDAVAAAFLARRLRRPLVVTARGTDVNLIPDYATPRAWLRYLLRRTQGAIAVCEALRVAMAPLHSPELPVRVLGNGVDLDKFRPLDRRAARERRGWRPDGPIVLSVGHLIERKGHHHLIDAIPGLPPEVLVKIVGQGERLQALRERARRLGVEDRVEFCGPLPHPEMASAYAAADALALLSSREGWPNVLLEAMACGTPVLATRVWGAPEVVRSDGVGLLLDEPSPPAVAAAVRELLAQPRDRSFVRRYAEQHSWDRVADGMQEVFEAALAAFDGRRTVPAWSSSDGRAG